MRLSDQILALIQETFENSGEIGSPMTLHEPRFDPKDQEYVRDCIETGWVSSVGKYVDGFEKKLTEITGIANAVAIVNGTCALHACLVLVGTEAGDEVLVPSLTFVATANAVHQCGAIPHFVASDEKTLGVDPDKLEDYLDEIAEIRNGVAFNKRTGRRLRALVPVHIYGTPCNLERLEKTCHDYNLELVEDAAESLGSYYGKKHTGSVGRLAAVSFNGNKIVTTGGGGAILTTDSELAKHAKYLTTTAKKPHPYKFFHDYAGFNYRMPNLNAALGLSQLERFEKLLANKKTVHEAYARNASGKSGYTIHEPPKGSTSNYWLNVAIATADKATEVESVFEKTLGAQIQTRPAWDLLHHLPMYAQCPRMDLRETEKLAARLICLPSSPHLAAHVRKSSRAA